MFPKSKSKLIESIKQFSDTQILSYSFDRNFDYGIPHNNVSVKNDTQHFSDFDFYSSKATAGVDFRAKNFDSIENLEKNSIDFYASVKSLYLQDRQQKILNSKKIVNTQNDSDWEEIEN